MPEILCIHWAEPNHQSAIVSDDICCNCETENDNPLHQHSDEDSDDCSRDCIMLSIMVDGTFRNGTTIF
jgi:hypothetical protein